MKKERITNIIFILIVMVAFLIIPVKVFASSFKVPFNRADGYVTGRAIFGIYKAIYVTEKENPSNKWLNAKSAYIGGEPDSNGNEVDWVWEGEWGTTVQEYKDAGISMNANGVYKLVNSKYAACVGHNDSDIGSGNDKIVRAININTSYANTVGYKYSTKHGNDFKKMQPVDLLTMGVATQRAVNGYYDTGSAAYREAVKALWYQNKEKLIIDDVAKKYLEQSTENGELADTTYVNELKKRAQEIVNEKLESSSKENDGKTRTIEYNENLNYTFIGPYNISTAGVYNDWIVTVIKTDSGNEYRTYDYSTNKSQILNIGSENPSIRVDNYSSNSFYIAVKGKISGNIKSIEMIREYWNVRARIVAVFATATGGQNFIMFDGDEITESLSKSLPVPKGIKLTIKKYDPIGKDGKVTQTPKALTGARFVIQDKNTKEYLSRTTSGGTSRTKNPGESFENVTRLKHDSSITIDKDGEYIFWEIQSPKISETDKRSIYYSVNEATPKNPKKIATITIKNFKVTARSDEDFVSYTNNADGMSATVVLYNYKQYSHLNIYKTCDLPGNTMDGKTLHNVEFIVQYGEDGKNAKYLKFDKEKNDKPVEYVSKEQATRFSIPADKDYAEVNYLTKAGVYKILEVKAENSGYPYASIEKPIVKGNNTIELGLVYNFHLTNTPTYRPLRVKKIDSETKKPLGGVQFIIEQVTKEGNNDKNRHYFISNSNGIGSTTTTKPEKATVFTTVDDAKGILINGLKIGKRYKLLEIKTDTEQGYKYASLDEPVDMPVQPEWVESGWTYEFTINKDAKYTEAVITGKNTKAYKSYKIIKTDKDSGKRIPGVGFVLKCETEGRKGFFVEGAKGEESKSVEYIKDATVFVTDANGEVTINKLIKGCRYKVYEVQSNPESGYKEVSKDDPIIMNQEIQIRGDADSNVTEFKLQNQKIYRNVNLVKVDVDSGKRIDDVEFILYDKTEGKYFVQGDVGKDSALAGEPDQATKYTTKNGEAAINKLLIDHHYIVYEVNSNPDLGYKATSYDNPLQVKLKYKNGNNQTVETDELVPERTKENETLTVEGQNLKVFRNIKLIKKDEDSEKEIEGVGLILYDKTKGKYFVQGPTGKESTLTDKPEQATLYITKKGGVPADKLTIGHTYIIYEVISNPEIGYQYTDYYNNMLQIGKEFTVGRSTENEVIVKEIYNRKIYRNIHLVKKDADSGIEIEGVDLIFYDKDLNGYFIQGENGKPSEITTVRTQATKYTTQKGGIDINKLLIGHTYIAYEVKTDPEIGYEYGDYEKPFAKPEYNEFKIKRDKENERVEITILNKRIYRNIKIIKIDYDTNEEIEGMGLILYDDTAKGYFIQGATGKPSELTNDIKQATLYMTQKGGVDVNKLLIDHHYTVYEVISNPDIGYEFTGYGQPYESYEPLDVGNFNVNRDKENTRLIITVKNKKVYMNVNIKKVDQDQHDKELKKIGLILYDIENKKYVVSGAPCTFVERKEEATIFETKNGGILIKYLARHHSYIVYEVENPIYGYTDVSMNKPLEIGRFTLSGNDATLEHTAENQKITGNLIIDKKDKDAENWVFDGVGFKIKNSEGKYLIALDENKKVQTKVNGKIYLGGLLTTTDENQATEFITDSNSRVEIYNILRDTYQVIETSIGEQFGYEVDNDYVSWETSDSSGNGLTATVVVNRQNSRDTELNTANIENGKYDKLIVRNRRKYIKISGFAWEDRAQGKSNEIDGVWKENTEDKKLKDITVRLNSSNGKTLATKETDSDGNYIFGNYDEDSNATKIKIDDIVGGYLEFEYNGMSYKTVPINSEFNLEHKDNKNSVINGIDNSASDEKQREAFNSNYAIISNNKSHTADGSIKYTLEYDYDQETHISTLKYGDNVKYGYEGQVYPSSGVEKQYLIDAITQTNSEKALCTQYNADDIRRNSVTEIAGINLGITLREQADLAVASDLNSVDIKINRGTETYVNTYSYAKRNLDDENDMDNFGVDVKFGVKNSSTPSYSDRGLNLYTRRIYESDLVYANSDASKELMQVYVTYRIRVKNQASSLNAKVAELVNYYDSRYTIEDSWLADSKGNKTRNATWGVSRYGNIAKMESGYTATYTNALSTIEIAPNKYQDIYIKFKLNNNAVRELLNKQTTLNNVSEISAFSTLKDNKIYAAIDEDSNPGNAEIKRLGINETPEISTAQLHEKTYQIENKTLDTSTFEDDTDYAPALILGIEEDKPTRGLSGTVFEDANTTTDEQHGDGTKTHPKEIRIGNGIFDKKDGEKGVKNAKVELLEYDADEEDNIAKDSKGNAKVATLYQVIIKDGGTLETNKVPACVATKDDGTYEFSGVLPGKYLIRYTYGSNIMIGDTVIGDTMIGDKKIDSVEYKSTIITSNIIKNALSLDKEPIRMGDLNWILAYDGKQYSDAVDDLTKRAKQEENGVYYGNLESVNSQMTADTAFFDVGVEYSEVQKEFNEEVTFTNYEDEYNLEDGKIMVIKEDGTIKLVDTFYAVNPYQDFGIIERARQAYQINKRISHIKLTLADGQTIINGNPYQEVGDLYKDWKNIEQSATGDKALPYVKALPNHVVAEIDNEIIQGATLEVEYTISLKNDSEKDYEYKTNPNYYYYGIVTSEDKEIKTVVKKIVDYMEDDMIYSDEKNAEFGWKKVKPEELTEYQDNGIDKMLINKDNIDDIKKGYIISINTNIDDIELNAGEAASIKIYGSKLLSNKERGIKVKNHVEIVESSRKITGVTPGNYDPKTLQENEADNNYTMVSITPPTGLTTNNKNRVFIISILGVSLIALAGGVYFIKKKVLK